MSDSSEALLSRVASLEEKLASGGFTPLSPLKPKNDIEVEPKKNDEEVKAENNDVTSRQLHYWSEVIQTVERTDPGSSGHLKSSKAYFDGSVVTIHVTTEFAVMLLNNDQTRALIASGINLNDETISLVPDNIKFTVDKSVLDESDPLDSL